MNSFRINATLYIESFKPENEILEALNRVTNCNLGFYSEDEDKNVEWVCSSLGFYVTLTKYGHNKLKNWYSFSFQQQLNMISDDYTSVLNINLHFIRLFSQLGFENVLTSEEFNEEFHRRNY